MNVAVLTTANLKKEQATVCIQSRNIILNINTNTELVSQTFYSCLVP